VAEEACESIRGTFYFDFQWDVEWREIEGEEYFFCQYPPSRSF
jgi:hypothetical protein